MMLNYRNSKNRLIGSFVALAFALSMRHAVADFVSRDAAVIQKRAQFHVLAPSYLPNGYDLVKCKIAWIERIDLDPELPSRQAVCFFYNKKNGGELKLIQAAAVKGKNAQANVGLIIGNGHFFKVMKLGTRLHYGRIDGIDFCLLSKDLEHNELDKIVEALPHKNEKAKGQTNR